MSSINYLDKTGLSTLWGKIKGIIPTKTSDLTNDSGFITSISCATTAEIEEVCDALNMTATVITTEDYTEQEND